MLQHNKIAARAARAARAATAARCSSSTGWPSAPPTTVPAHLAAWPGPVWGLDLSGHGASSVAAGGGYFCEVLMGDVDAAIAHLELVTIYGRGLGAYIGLLAAGGRAEQVQGTILADGPGLAGGGPSPGSPVGRHRRRRAAARRHARPVGDLRAHARRPPARLRRHLRPPGQHPLRPRHRHRRGRRQPPAVARRRGGRTRRRRVHARRGAAPLRVAATVRSAGCAGAVRTHRASP